MGVIPLSFRERENGNDVSTACKYKLYKKVGLNTTNFTRHFHHL